MNSSQHKFRNYASVLSVSAFALLVLLLPCFSQPACAQDAQVGHADTTQLVGQAHTEQPGTFAQSMMVGSLLRTFAALAVVVVLIFAAIWLLKKMTKGRLIGATGTETLQVLNTAYLGARKSIALVKVADRAVLIGMSEQQMSPLLELSSEETRRVITEAGTKETQSGFGALLKQFTQTKAANKTTNE